MEIAAWSEPGPTEGVTIDEVFLAAGDSGGSDSHEVRALRVLAPEAVLARCSDLGQRAQALERLGVLLALVMHETRAAVIAGRMDNAVEAARRATDWIRRQALPHVPPPFIDSFVHRNPVNRELLAAVSNLS